MTSTWNKVRHPNGFARVWVDEVAVDEVAVDVAAVVILAFCVGPISSVHTAINVWVMDVVKRDIAQWESNGKRHAGSCGWGAMQKATLYNWFLLHNVPFNKVRESYALVITFCMGKRHFGMDLSGWHQWLLGWRTLLYILQRESFSLGIPSAKSLSRFSFKISHWRNLKMKIADSAAVGLAQGCYGDGIHNVLWVLVAKSGTRRRC